MILIIMPKSVFTKGFISFIQSNFNDDVVFLVVGSNEKFPVEETSKVISIESYTQLATSKKCRKLAKETSGIILSWVDCLALLLLQPYRSKLALLFWGGDIRFLRDSANGPLKHKLVGITAKKLVKKAPHILTLLPGDYEQLKALCNPQGTWHPVAIWDESLKKISYDKPTKATTGGTVRILLGNSATKTNRHIEALEMLSRFSSQDIEIIAPLSYGDSNYAEAVTKKGQSIFGSKFKSVTKFMDEDEYRDFLRTIPIGVFHNDRQQGLGNIRVLLAQGAKVYLSQDGPMLKDLSEKGLTVFATESIQKSSFDDFISFSEPDAEKNMETAGFENAAQEAVEMWGKVFEDFSGTK